MGVCVCCWRGGHTGHCRCSDEKCDTCMRCREHCQCLLGSLDLVIERLLEERPWPDISLNLASRESR